MSTLVMYIGTLLAIIVTSLLFYKWWTINHPKLNGVLPPGSMGFPLIGETFQFFTPNTSFDLSPFIKQRVQRHGPVFKTSLVGVPVIVSTDGDLNYFILQQEGKLFGSWYPNIKVFGRELLSTLNGSMHKYFRNMVLGLFGPESLKKRISDVEIASNKNLKKWSHNPTVELKDAIAKMIFGVTTNMLISCDEEFGDKLRSNFLAFIDGWFSFPLKIPGTAYYKCLQGRQNAMKMLTNMLQERRERPRSIQTDFFDYVLEELAKEDTLLTETMALEFMLVLIFASYETTSQALTFAMKLLADHPLVLQKLTLSMAKIHPNTSMNHPSSEKETFTVWMKSLILNGKGCTVFDTKGEVVFRVDNYQTRSSKVFLMDSLGNLLFSVHKKKFGVHECWEGFNHTDSNVNNKARPWFKVTRSHLILSNDMSCQVTLASSNMCNCKITGLKGKSSFKITDFSNQIMAEIREKQSSTGISLGGDVMTLMVEPGVDVTLTMALVTVYGLINKKL